MCGCDKIDFFAFDKWLCYHIFKTKPRINFQISVLNHELVVVAIRCKQAYYYAISSNSNCIITYALLVVNREEKYFQNIAI